MDSTWSKFQAREELTELKPCCPEVHYADAYVGVCLEETSDTSGSDESLCGRYCALTYLPEERGCLCPSLHFSLFETAPLLLLYMVGEMLSETEVSQKTWTPVAS